MRYTIFLFAAASLVAQQAPAPAVAPPRTPVVSGKVINTAGGEGVRKATVLLRSQNGPNGISYAAEADGNGSFRIEDVDPGKYAVSAERQGFMLHVSGAPGAPPPTITVEKDQPVEGVTIRLDPLGVITGKVVDEDGDPVRGAMVQTMTYRYISGKRQLATGQRVMANEKGEYRLYDLRPGTYYLYSGSNYSGGIMNRGEAIRGPRPPGRATTYFPSAADAAHAVPIEVTAGAQLRGFDIHMRRERVFSVRGKLPESADQNKRYFVRVMSRDSHLNFGSFGSVINNTSFECPGLPPGEYVLVATMFDGTKQIPARQNVEIVDSDVEVILNFAPPSDVAGTVRVDGKLPKSLDDLRISLQPQGPGGFGGMSAAVKPDGTFLLKNVIPDVYSINFNAPEGMYVKSMGAGEQDATNWKVDLTKGSGPIAITLGTDLGVVEGSVENEAGDPLQRVRVTLIPYGNHLGRSDLSRFAFTDEKGHFKMRGTGPGEYKLFAWDNVDPGAPQDPEFRKPFEKQAVGVKLEPNGHETVKLKVIHVEAAKE